MAETNHAKLQKAEKRLEEMQAKHKEQLAAQKDKQKAAEKREKAKIAKLKAAEAKKERKARNHMLIVMGSMVEHFSGKDAFDMDLGELYSYLKQYSGQLRKFPKSHLEWEDAKDYTYAFQRAIRHDDEHPLTREMWEEEQRMVEEPEPEPDIWDSTEY